MTVPVVLVRLALFCIGATLMYSYVLYEDEESLVQSRLEDWWVKLDDKSNAAISRQTIFVQAVARSLNHFLDKLFGAELVSVRSISVSVCYSIAASFSWSAIVLVVTSLVIPYLGSEFPAALRPIVDNMLFDARFYAPVAVCLVFAGVAPAIWPKLSWLPVLTAALAIITTESLMLLSRFRVGIAGSEGGVSSEAHLMLALPLSTLCDLYVITLTRKVLRKSAAAHTLRYAMGLLSLAIVAFFLIVGMPMVLCGATQLYFLGVLGWMNFPSGLLLGVFFFTAALMLAHRAFWPTILWPLYAAQKGRFVSNKKVLISIGVACIVTAVAPSGIGAVQLLEKVWKSVGH